MSDSPRISIIVPAHDTEAWVGECLATVRSADSTASVEIIVVDDGSSDGTASVARAALTGHPRSRIIATGAASGPGGGRNAGLAIATGRWVLFVDSDDTLAPGAIDAINVAIDAADSDVDVIAFDWCDHPDSMVARSSTRTFGRRDLPDLADLDRRELAERYLRLLIDPSVIYMAVRRDHLTRHGLTFREGLHEDFDFTLGCILNARRIAVLHQVLVNKRARSGSVVHTISRAHLEGFADGWRHAVDLTRSAFPDDAVVEDAIAAGRVALLATRAREITRHVDEEGDAMALLQVLREVFVDEVAEVTARPPTGSTVYEMIARRVAAGGNVNDVIATIRDLDRRSWSCPDLQRSVFLRPNQVRTCCKRFFVDGEMRGDVVLLQVEDGDQPTAQEVLAAKRDLHWRINSGISTPCSGCPFLALAEWEPLDHLDVRYLSMEQHSVCDLRCTYCSDEYYDGARPVYDVRVLVEDMGDADGLSRCEVVVWGGGEPSVARDFDEMTRYLPQVAPHATQRFLTNSTRFSPAIAAGLEAGHAQVVTSIDAGTPETFRAVRGRDRMDEVIATLEKYAEINADRVTVKYIFTEGNAGRDEVRAFIARIGASTLRHCFFQISADFKHETMSFDELAAAVQMFSGLREIGIDFVCLDELFRQRLQSTSPEVLRDDADRHDWTPVIADPGTYDRIAIWGAGQATRLLMGTRFIEQVPVTLLVDASPGMEGVVFDGHLVRAPTALLASDEPVILSAVQGLPLMAAQAAAIGLPRGRLVLDLVL